MARRLARTRPEERLPRDGYRAVGVVDRPRGLKGELKARPLTDFPQRFAHGATVYIAGLPRTVSAANWQQGSVYLTVDGVNDRDAAEALRNELIEVPDAERPVSDQLYWYIDEIEGLLVVDRDGAELGAIREVLQTGANDVYVVDRGEPRDLLVPALSDVVVEIDLKRGRMIVDLPDGLLPEM